MPLQQAKYSTVNKELTSALNNGRTLAKNNLLSYTSLLTVDFNDS